MPGDALLGYTWWKRHGLHSAAHDASPDVAEHWDVWKHLLPDPSTAPVSSCLGGHPHRRGRWVRGLGSIHARSIPSLGGSW